MSKASLLKTKSKPRPAEQATAATVAPVTAPTGPKGWVTSLTCAILLIAFAVTAWSAARTKCATYDEPMHALGAYMISHYGDFRVNPEDPPLWQWWMSLATRRGSLKPNFSEPWYNVVSRFWEQTQGELKLNFGDPLYGNTPGNDAGRWGWVTNTFYHTPGNDPDAFIMRMRTMLLLLGVALGGVIAWWSWRLAGGVAAIAAVVLFALDPNFLAHAAVVKNDVALSLVGAALAMATWCAGRRLTRATGLAVILLGAAALVTKFSGPLLLIALAVTLAVRVALPLDWPCGQRVLKTRRARAAAAAMLLLLTGLAGYFTIWACYDFRFEISRDGRVWNTEPMIWSVATNEVAEQHPDQPYANPADIEWRVNHPAPAVRVITFCEDHHLLPDSFCYGMLYVYRSSRVRDNFLLGQHSNVGFRSYFPLAFLFKTPVATLLSLFLAAGVGTGVVLAWRKRRRSNEAAVRDSAAMPAIAPVLWTVACLAVPFAIMGVADVRAHLNIGLRHILPLYPFLYVAAGCAAARAWRRWGRNGRIVIAGLAAALLLETAAAFPNYIAFFNHAVGGTANGINLLADSNLDWGQDLPLLAKWQHEHPGTKLYLHYFGTADPAYYGIQYALQPGFEPPRNCVAPIRGDSPREPGVVAISATYLQGVYIGRPMRPGYESMRKNSIPRDVLGGTIYLYDYNPTGAPPK